MITIPIRQIIQATSLGWADLSLAGLNR